MFNSRLMPRIPRISSMVVTLHISESALRTIEND